MSKPMAIRDPATVVGGVKLDGPFIREQPLSFLQWMWLVLAFEYAYFAIWAYMGIHA